jgi:hypothetical protein
VTTGNAQIALTWTPVTGVSGYNVYYDQSGKAQLVADAGSSSNFTDTGLTNGETYCYKLTAYNQVTVSDQPVRCESAYSDIQCATPQNQGQTTLPAGVSTMEAGYWSGKGQNQTFKPSPIPLGETVVIRTLVTDGTNPISNATVEITIGGPESVTLNSNPSDAAGWAEASWNTQAPNRKGQGGTTLGDYTATTTDVTASGYHWNSVTTATPFTL